LVFHSSTIAMMHGPINIRLKNALTLNDKFYALLTAHPYTILCK